MRISRLHSFLLSCVVALGASSAGAVSSKDVLKGMSSPAKVIIALVNSKADGDWLGFCTTGAPAIREAVTSAAMKLTEDGMIDQKVAMSAGGETTAYYYARCAEAAGAPGGKSATQIHGDLSETARLIVAEVKSDVGGDMAEFCRDNGSGIQVTVTNVATRMAEDEVIDESDAYDATDELTRYYIAFCTERAIKAVGAVPGTASGGAGGGHDRSAAMLKTFGKGDRMIIVAANQQMGGKLESYCKTDNSAITTVVTDMTIRLIEQEKIGREAARTVTRSSAKFYPLYCRELQIIAATNGR